MIFTSRQIHFSVFHILLCFALSVTVFSQDIKTINDLRFKHYQLKEGLPTHAAERIFEDDQGLLWIGTYSGLMRYDGYEFKKILDGKVNAIFQDNKGYLWVGTNQDLIRYDPRTAEQRSFYYRAKQTKLDDRYDIISITQDKTGAICVGTAFNGLIRYIEKSRDSFAMHRYPNKRSTALNYKNMVGDTIIGNWIWQMHTDSQGNTWLGTYGSLTQMIIPDISKPEVVKFKTVVPDKIPFNQGDIFRIHSFMPDHAGNFWIVSSHVTTTKSIAYYIFKYDPRKNKFLYYESHLNNMGERYIIEDSQRNIWMGQAYDPLQLIPPDSILQSPTNISEFIIKGSKKYRFVEPGDNVISINNVQGFLEDSSGSLWVLSNFLGV